jgi:hypothetical protein
MQRLFQGLTPFQLNTPLTGDVTGFKIPISKNIFKILTDIAAYSGNPRIQ